ncbi:site-specific integrase [Desulfobaculum bizertense]|uniref:tyrosine-type recombinase/integrase n=1 Tax=Desulfobaculum bizertense TaxID=376490 RepID=UPI001F39E0EC|nr:tyrosine-type recombinase/integrase [Desulfobaculum bizertense]UIJ36911.1 site-specific integrase [Desulfobaculum bizertense]
MFRGGVKIGHKLTVGEAVKAYVTWAKAEGKSIQREIPRYTRHMAPRFDALYIESITPMMLTSHKAELLESLSEQSVVHLFSFLRRCINFAINSKMYMGPNPASSNRNSMFRLKPADNASVRFFSPQEARALLEHLEMRSQSVHDMSLLSLKTGMRATEIFRLTGFDIDVEAELLHVHAKGGKRQTVHAPADVMEMLLSYGRRGSEYIFQSRSGGKITNGISKVFRRSVLDLGIDTPDSPPEMRVRFHAWRHTFASWLAQSGKVTLHEIKELLRHEKIEMTLRYSHLLPGHQKESMKIIGDVLDDHPQA